MKSFNNLTIDACLAASEGEVQYPFHVNGFWWALPTGGRNYLVDAGDDDFFYMSINGEFLKQVDEYEWQWALEQWLVTPELIPVRELKYERLCKMSLHEAQNMGWCNVGICNFLNAALCYDAIKNKKQFKIAQYIVDNINNSWDLPDFIKNYPIEVLNIPQLSRYLDYFN